jgi:hypothetical protein
MSDILEEVASLLEVEDLREAMMRRTAKLAISHLNAPQCQEFIEATAAGASADIYQDVREVAAWRLGFQVGVAAGFADKTWAARFLDLTEENDWRTNIGLILDGVIGYIPVHVPLPWPEDD